MNGSIIVTRPLRKPRLAPGVYPAKIVAVEELKSVMTPRADCREEQILTTTGGLSGAAVSDITAVTGMAESSAHYRLLALLQPCGKCCKISHIVRATNRTGGALWCRLLTLEALETVRATREWDSTTYFLSDIEEEPG